MRKLSDHASAKHLRNRRKVYFEHSKRSEDFTTSHIFSLGSVLLFGLNDSVLVPWIVVCMSA